MLAAGIAAPLPSPAFSYENERSGAGGGAFQLAGTMPQEGDDRERLLGELYHELRARAERYMRGQPPDLTLQPTGLVHEACLKLFARERLESEDREHLLALASTTMCNFLVDHVRARNRVKRTAPGERVPLDAITIAFEEGGVDLVALHEALERLAEFDVAMVRAVELRFFGGVSFEETARELGVPMWTFERRWAAARAWLRAEIE